MILSRPFLSRPYSDSELIRWFGSLVADTPQAPLRRVVHLPLVWNEKWDLWAKSAIATGALVPPRSTQ